MPPRLGYPDEKSQPGIGSTRYINLIQIKLFKSIRTSAPPTLLSLWLPIFLDEEIRNLTLMSLIYLNNLIEFDQLYYHTQSLLWNEP